MDKLVQLARIAEKELYNT